MKLFYIFFEEIEDTSIFLNLNLEKNVERNKITEE